MSFVGKPGSRGRRNTARGAPGEPGWRPVSCVGGTWLRLHLSLSAWSHFRSFRGLRRGPGSFEEPLKAERFWSWQRGPALSAVHGTGVYPVGGCRVRDTSTNLI
jgi:hypothetical protein